MPFPAFKPGGWRRTPRRSSSLYMSVSRGPVRNSFSSISTSPALKVCYHTCQARVNETLAVDQRVLKGGVLVIFGMVLFSQRWVWPIRERPLWCGTKRPASRCTGPLVSVTYIKGQQYYMGNGNDQNLVFFSVLWAAQFENIIASSWWCHVTCLCASLPAQLLHVLSSAEWFKSWRHVPLEFYTLGVSAWMNPTAADYSLIFTCAKMCLLLLLSYRKSLWCNGIFLGLWLESQH